MIPDSEIPKCPEFEVESKRGNIFKNHNFLEEYSVRIYETDPYFYDHYEKQIQVDENGHKNILFRIDIYSSECFLAVEIDEKGHTDRDIIFKEKRQFIIINTSNAKNGYDLDYDIGNIQAFIDKFRNKKNILEKKI